MVQKILVALSGCKNRAASWAICHAPLTLKRCIAAAGKPEWDMYSSVGVLSINVVGNIVLIPEYGIVGAAWATSMAYCFNALVKAWLVRRIN